MPPAPAQSPTPTPAPTATTANASPGYIVAQNEDGGPGFVAPFDVANGLQPSWGTGAIPELYTLDRSEGAFRFTCGGAANLRYDDPVVYPGQPGKSHLHQPWGNADFNADTTPATLAASAETDCNATRFSLNRSLYWMPALVLANSTTAIQPDLISVYYKRSAKGSAQCDPASPLFVGKCVSLPNQIRFIFGWNAAKPTAKVEGATWYCTGGTGKHYSNLDDVFASGCKPGDTLVANTIAPNCWDGKYLDTPDHRSHMAYAGWYTPDGQRHCPENFPYLIPQEENKAMWTVTADMIGPDGRSRVMLASDHMLPGARPGETLHADYVETWDFARQGSLGGQLHRPGIVVFGRRSGQWQAAYRGGPALVRVGQPVGPGSLPARVIASPLSRHVSGGRHRLPRRKSQKAFS